MSGRVAWIGITAGAAIMLSPVAGWLLTAPWGSEGEPTPPDHSPAWQSAYDACFESNLRYDEQRRGVTRDRLPQVRLDYFETQCTAYADRIEH